MQLMITVANENGRWTCDPGQVKIGPGDTVRWTCAKGDLTVDFGKDTPFTVTQVWSAPRNQITPEAVVNAGLPAAKVFRPRMSIDETVVAEPFGDLIVR